MVKGKFVGRVFRKFFIDEVPMVINLVRGDLKFFGVRPLSSHYLSLYPDEFQAYRNQFKPGLIPPFYVDMPQSLEEVIESEANYLKEYESHTFPFLVDVKYSFKAFYNIVINKARSK